MAALYNNIKFLITSKSKHNDYKVYNIYMLNHRVRLQTALCILDRHSIDRDNYGKSIAYDYVAVCDVFRVLNVVFKHILNRIESKTQHFTETTKYNPLISLFDYPKARNGWCPNGQKR